METSSALTSTTNKVWVQKHVPAGAKAIVGQDKAVAALKKFIVNFKQEKRKAAFVHGPTGCGKTSSVQAIAKELGLEVIEVNASDFRTGDAINSIIGTASRQMSLFSKGKVILIDEIDGVSGNQDRGGIPALLDVIDRTAFPVILTANDPFDKKFSNIRQKSLMVEFELLTPDNIHQILKDIADKEGIKYDDNALKALSRRAGGDARAAVNDLQMLSAGKKFEKEDLDALSDREFTKDIKTALTQIFKTTDPIIAKQATEHVTEDLNEISMWIQENLPKEYEKPADLARAYDYISKADVMNRRIRRWQHWRFLTYIGDYLSAGIAVSKDEKYKKMTEIEQSKRPLSIWMANRKYMKRMTISERIATKTHTSKKEAVKSTFPFIKAIFQSKDKQMMASIAEEFEFDEEEVSYLKK